MLLLETKRARTFARDPRVEGGSGGGWRVQSFFPTLFALTGCKPLEIHHGQKGVDASVHSQDCKRPSQPKPLDLDGGRNASHDILSVSRRQGRSCANAKESSRTRTVACTAIDKLYAENHKRE